MIRPPTSRRARWACLRLQIIGPLLAAPPKSGELRERLEELARGNYLHPVTSAPTRFGASTLERWYYQARNAGDDPVSRAASSHRTAVPRASALELSASS
jgi:putative transposase